MRILGVTLEVLPASLSLLMAHSCLRLNRVMVDPAVVVETWETVSDGADSSDTDLTFWDGHYYPIHASLPCRLASGRLRLRLLRSDSAWE